MYLRPPLAFLDANVLFSRTLRDWICLLCLDSEKTAFQLRWSEDVLAEWIYRMRRKYPSIPDDSLGRHRRWLEEAFPEAMVRGYRPSEVPQPPDLNDWHVLAAAVSVPVDFLVTSDKRGFDRAQAGSLEVEVINPDGFLTFIADRHPELIQVRLANQIAYLRTRPPGSSFGEAEEEARLALVKAGAAQFAERLRSRLPTEPVS